MASGEARSVALETAYVHEVYEEISGAHSSWSGAAAGFGSGGALGGPLGWGQAAGAGAGLGAGLGVGAAAGPPGPGSRARPKVAQFLHDLEPGSLVCDVGCGNGKYLSINPAVFKIGADRCQSLTEAAREKDHEVLVCDNLALPFRDDVFDAVLSVAVVHHLATTERRVSAIRELTRVLRIGGRLIITVWAMEQRHRKFESQDVLVPWHRPQQLSTPSLELTSTTTTTTSDEDLHPPYHAYTQTSDSDSCRSARMPGQRRRGRNRHKGRSIDSGALPHPMSASQSSSSLSSPNETCYSFVRRALQKLAGGKRSAGAWRSGTWGSGPWFLDTWGSVGQVPRRHEPEGCEDSSDIQDLPIELRRLEEDSDPPNPPPSRRQTLTSPLPLHGKSKSKSLSDILTSDSRSRSSRMVRSTSSAHGALHPPHRPALDLKARTSCPEQAVSTSTVASTSTISLSLAGSSSSGGKPRLVKQKQSMCEEDEEAEGGDQPTDMRDLVRAMPDFKRLQGPGALGARTPSGATPTPSRTSRLNVFKQSSMNEELMSAERLREKERLRQNIQKQASLNEELMYRRGGGGGGGGHTGATLDSLRDTIFSASTAKRFQLLKIGLTSKLKSSTTNIEKVAGSSLKNGFVRMLQGWKQTGEAPHSTPPPSRQASCNTPNGSLTPSTPPPDGSCGKRPSTGSINGADRGSSGGERRHSREDGSDSSKDSSLQSDTSVDSEDSFASVIFVPKADQYMSQDPKTPSPTLCTSAPPSPSPLCQSPQPPSSPRLAPPPATTPGDPLTVPVIPVLPTTAFLEQHEGRLQQIRDALRHKNIGGRGMFPLVRRSSGSLPRPCQPRAAPRLMSLELFNPETDDVDSDSSGVSSPDSVDSVISVAGRCAPSPSPAAVDVPSSSVLGVDLEDAARSVSRTPSPAPPMEPPPAPPRSQSVLLSAPDTGPSHSSSTPASLSLLEAVADVASSLEDAVEAVIQSSPRARRRQMNLEAADPRVALEECSSSSGWTWQQSPETEQAEPGSPPIPKVSRITESVSRFSLPGSLGVSNKQQDLVFKFPSSKVDSLRSGRRAGSAGRLHEPVDYTSLGAIPKNKMEAEPFHLSTKINEPEATALTAIPETPGPFPTDSLFMGAKPTEQTSISPSKRGIPPLVLSPREGQVADGSAGARSPLEENFWDESVRQHLAGFAEQLSERLLEEIERYGEATSPGVLRDPYLIRLGEELQGLSKLSAELQERQRGPSDKIIASLAKNVDSSSELLSNLTLGSLPSLDSSEALTGVSSLSSSIRSARSTDELQSEASDAEASNPPTMYTAGSAPSSSRGGSGYAPRGTDSPAGEVEAGEVARHEIVAQLRSGCSVESSDGGDFSERTGTGSGTDCTDSRRDTSSAGKTASSASLGTMESSDNASDCSRDVRFADRRTARCDGRSSSEETPGNPRGAHLVRQKAAVQEPPEGVTKTESCATSLSGSTSQDSLPSDNGGGAITYHRYYHVFREGELDQLIEHYVENLHIISSFYDHTNWCVVAEKVQVWTI